MSNAGVVNINSGTVNFGSTTTHTGTINVASGATLQNTNNFTDNGAINIASATFANNGGTFTQNNLIEFTGTVTATNSATWNVNVAQSLSNTATLNNSGILGGSGSLLINGAMNWTSNTVGVNLTIASGAILTVSTGSVKYINSSKTLVNQGTMNWTGGELQFNNATLQNEGDFNQGVDVFFENAGGTNLFNNTSSGTFTKSAGAGTSTFNIPVTNAGTVNINNGTVNFASSTTNTNTGIINVASGATLQNTNNFTDNGAINIVSATFLNGGGTFTQNNLISFTGTATANNGATWNVNVTQELNSTAILNHSGVLGGSGSLLINGAMNWTNNSVGVNLTIASGAGLTMSTGSTKTLNSSKTLLNQGTINLTGGGFNFTNGTVQNEGVFDQSVDVFYENAGGTNLFNNTSSGTFIKSGGAGSSTFNIPVTNAGTIKGIGTIYFSGSLVNSGTIAPGLSPGIITINGEVPFSANSILSIELLDGSGAGTGHDQLQRAGNLTLAGTLTVTETGTVPIGSYTIISLTSGSISGNFSTTNFPAGYYFTIKPTTVELTKVALQTFYQDADSDTYGNPAVTVQDVSAPPGYVADNTDCDDTNAAIHPGATEVCNGTDDDCDGQIDEAVLSTFYQDADSDGFGWAAKIALACTAPAGYVNNNTDCNDANAAIYPGATEVCNGIDDDCDGQIDEAVQSAFYQDSDGDGYGNAAVTTQACTAPAGYVNNNTDCNDANAAVYPGATEVCNGIDDDCDGLIDEAVQSTFYRDADGDGYGNAAVTTQACTTPSGYINNNTDCNDANAAIHPSATEACNGIDDDCDGLIDEGCPVAISIADKTVLESAGPALVAVTLTVSSASTVTVKYKTMNGTAMQRKDYTSTSGTITFLPGQTSKNVSVPIIADAITEGNETFFIILSKPTNATISDGSATVTITESAPPVRIKSNPVREVQNTEEIKLVIPNPQRKQEQLRFFGLQPGSFDVVLTDVNGKVAANLRKYRNNWSMARLFPGIYFYKVLYKNQKGELTRSSGKLFITE